MKRYERDAKMDEVRERFLAAAGELFDTHEEGFMTFLKELADAIRDGNVTVSFGKPVEPTGEFPANSEQAGTEPGKKKRGRPPGSKKISTAEHADIVGQMVVTSETPGPEITQEFLPTEFPAGSEAVTQPDEN